MTKQTQHQKILAYLKAHREITIFECFAKLGITKLQTRLTEMRRAGIPVSRGRWIDVKSGKRVKAYWLERRAA